MSMKRGLLFILAIQLCFAQDLSLWPDWAFTAPDNVIHAYPGDDVFTMMGELEPGDKLIIHEGEYTVNKWYVVDLMGTEDAPIFIEGAEGEHVILRQLRTDQNMININARYASMRNLDMTGGDAGLRLQDVQHFIFEDCVLHDLGGNAIPANSGPTNNLYFFHNEIYNTGGHGEGFYLGSHHGYPDVTHDTIVYNNLVHDMAVTNPLQGDGIEVKPGSYGNLVKDNVVYNTRYPGIITYGTDGKVQNIIEGNVVIDSQENGMQIQGDAIVRNNIVINSAAYGLQSKDHEGTAEHLQIMNNIFVTSGSAGVRFDNFGNRDDMVLANNVIYNPGRTAVAIGNGADGGTISGNVVLGSVPSVSGFSQGNSITEDFIGDMNYYPSDDTFSGMNQVVGHEVEYDYLYENRDSIIYAGAFEKLNDDGYAIIKDFKYPARVGGYGEPLLCEKEEVLCVDDTPGDTQEYDDIQDALNDATAGDTVLIHAGTYTPGSRLEVQASGTESSPLTIKGADGAVIDGSSHSSDILNVEFFDNIIIEGLEVRNAGRAGIRLTHSDYSIVRDNYAHDNYKWGIFTSFCDDILIEDNECSGSEDEHGIYFSNSADRPTIRGNTVHHNNKNGIHMNGDISCDSDVYHNVDGVISQALVENNIIYENGANGGSAINCDGVRDSVIRNNLIYRQHSSGISLYQINGGDTSEGNAVYHNTIVIADDGRWAVNLKDGSIDNSVYNNILLSEHATHGSFAMEFGPDGLDSDHNIIVSENVATPYDDGTNFYDFSEWQALGFDAHSYQAEIDDLFVNFPTDMHLKDSVAVDRGTDVGVQVDLSGNTRPNGNGYDIGCYESGYSYESPQCTEADLEPDGEISNEEMKLFVDSWLAGDESLLALLEVIQKWKEGC